jgi:hypothetical protein
MVSIVNRWVVTAVVYFLTCTAVIACQVTEDVEVYINTGGAAWEPQSILNYKDGVLNFSYFWEYETDEFYRKVDLEQRFILDSGNRLQFLRLISEANVGELDNKYQDESVADGLLISIVLTTNDCHKEIEIRNYDLPQVTRLLEAINSDFAPIDIQLFLE